MTLNYYRIIYFLSDLLNGIAALTFLVRVVLVMKTGYSAAWYSLVSNTSWVQSLVFKLNMNALH